MKIYWKRVFDRAMEKKPKEMDCLYVWDLYRVALFAYGERLSKQSVFNLSGYLSAIVIMDDRKFYILPSGPHVSIVRYRPKAGQKSIFELSLHFKSRIFYAREVNK